MIILLSTREKERVAKRVRKRIEVKRGHGISNMIISNKSAYSIKTVKLYSYIDTDDSVILEANKMFSFPKTRKGANKIFSFLKLRKILEIQRYSGFFKDSFLF